MDSVTKRREVVDERRGEGWSRVGLQEGRGPGMCALRKNKNEGLLINYLCGGKSRRRRKEGVYDDRVWGWLGWCCSWFGKYIYSSAFFSSASSTFFSSASSSEARFPGSGVWPFSIFSSWWR